MKRVGGRGRGWTHEDEDRGSGNASTSQHTLPTCSSLRSPRSREAHDRGTRQSRRAIVSIIIGCVLLAVGRPVYGPYIDRFGEEKNKGVIHVVKQSLAKRAERHDLTLPRSWGHHRYGSDREGDIVGSNSLKSKETHASEHFSWRKAYEHLKEKTLEEREHLLRGMWEKLVLAESSAGSLETKGSG